MNFMSSYLRIVCAAKSNPRLRLARQSNDLVDRVVGAAELEVDFMFGTRCLVQLYVDLFLLDFHFVDTHLGSTLQAAYGTEETVLRIGSLYTSIFGEVLACRGLKLAHRVDAGAIGHRAILVDVGGIHAAYTEVDLYNIDLQKKLLPFRESR